MCRLRRVTDCCCAIQEAEDGQESLAVPQVSVLALPGMPGARPGTLPEFMRAAQPTPPPTAISCIVHDFIRRV